MFKLPSDSPRFSPSDVKISLGALVSILHVRRTEKPWDWQIWVAFHESSADVRCHLTGTTTIQVKIYRGFALDGRFRSFGSCDNGIFPLGFSYSYSYARHPCPPDVWVHTSFRIFRISFNFLISIDGALASRMIDGFPRLFCVQDIYHILRNNFV